MGMSDAISAYIQHMLDQADNGSAELQRNELAEKLGCVPSQISYVRLPASRGAGVSRGKPARRRRIYPGAAHPFSVGGFGAHAYCQRHW